MNFFENIINYFNFYVFFLILFASLFGVFYKKDLFAKLVCLSIFQTNIILFFLSINFNKGFKIPLFSHEILNDQSKIIIDQSLQFENPLPQVLMLTAIVVGLATFSLGLSILLKNQKNNL